MLSQELQSLAEFFAKYRRDGLQIEPEGIVAMVALLDTMTADAHALERVAVPAQARIDIAARGDLGPNVVVLPFQAVGPTTAIPFSGDVA